MITIGNILDDEELIHAMQAVKQATIGVKERIENAQESQKMIDTQRQYFLPVCGHTCVHNAFRVSFILDCIQGFHSVLLSFVAEKSGSCLSIFPPLVFEDLWSVH